MSDLRRPEEPRSRDSLKMCVYVFVFVFVVLRLSSHHACVRYHRLMQCMSMSRDCVILVFRNIPLLRRTSTS